MPSGPLATATSLPISAVEIDDEFWTPRVEKNHTVTIFHEYDQLEETGTFENFRRAAAGKSGGFEDPLFSDSDAYKWLEAASYILANTDDEALRERVDEVVDIVAGAQDENGYLNTYFTLVEPDGRWENFSFMHELYCAGHLFEAAVAHHLATDSEKLLNVARAFADHIDRRFGPDGHNAIPGHEVIELALIKLHRVTDEDRYLDLAQFFIEARGQDPSPMAGELANIEDAAGADFKHYDQRVADRTRGHYLDENGEYDGRYAQDHLPVREHETIEGHSVRATYFYTSVTSLLQERADEELRAAIDRVWENMRTKRMYVTGGLGSDPVDEGFTADYDLPNDTAYAETCAAVGNMFWNRRLFELTGNGTYVDLIERVLYNGFLVGVSLEGDKFFYVNPLATDGEYERESWFYVACCPTNAVRLLASLEKFIYAANDDSFYVNLFIGGEGTATVGDTPVTVEQETAYPWMGAVDLTVAIEEPAEFALRVRVPHWVDDVEVAVNGDSGETQIKDGYVVVDRQWEDGDGVSLSFELPTEVLRAHPNVDADVGRVALRRGPLVYAFEAADNPAPLDFLQVIDPTEIEVSVEPDLLGGVTTLTVPGSQTTDADWGDNLYRSPSEIESDPIELTAIPYYAWGHREQGEMRVWLRD